MARRYKKNRKREVQDWAQEQLDAYYSRRGISQTIRDTPVKNVDYYLSYTDVKAIYEKYNIRYFRNKEEFNKYFKDEGLINTHGNIEDRKGLLDKMWEDYKHRDALIRTGQYEDIRTQVYKENYIKALKAIGAPEYVINTLEKIDLKKWQILSVTPNADKGEESDTILPHLGGFAYSTKGDNGRFMDAQDYMPDILSAIEAIGEKDLLMSEWNEIYQAEERARSARLYYEMEQEEINRLRTTELKQVIRIIPKKVQEQLSDLYEAKDVRETIMGAIPAKTQAGRPRMRISRKGNVYIPFVGSQASSRTSQLVSEIFNEFERRGLSPSEFVEGWDRE